MLSLILNFNRLTLISPKLYSKFQVAEEDPQGPRGGLTQGLGQRRRHYITALQYVGTDGAHLEGTPVNIDFWNQS